MLTPWNDSVINPTQMSLVRQKSSRSSHNRTHELQASSIPSWNSPDPSNTMPLPSTNNGSRNIYGCIFDVSKLTPEKRQQHAVMLLQHYHELCNTNDPSSLFVSPPPITNIESLSKSNISSLDSRSSDRKRADKNIQQRNTSEVANIETVMAYNDDLYPPPPHDKLNVFAVVNFCLNHHMIHLNIYVHGTGTKEFVLLFSLLGKVQTHSVEHCPLPES